MRRDVLFNESFQEGIQFKEEAHMLCAKMNAIHSFSPCINTRHLKVLARVPHSNATVMLYATCRYEFTEGY